MDLDYLLVAFLFAVFTPHSSVSAAKQAKNDTADEVLQRFGFFDFFDGSSRQTCNGHFSYSGHCVTLLDCPAVLTKVRHINPGRIFQYLQDYVGPCGSRWLVCCPDGDGRDFDREPEPSRIEEGTWTWPESRPQRPRPSPQSQFPSGGFPDRPPFPDEGFPGANNPPFSEDGRFPGRPQRPPSDDTRFPERPQRPPSDDTRFPERPQRPPSDNTGFPGRPQRPPSDDTRFPDRPNNSPGRPNNPPGRPRDPQRPSSEDPRFPSRPSSENSNFPGRPSQSPFNPSFSENTPPGPTRPSFLDPDVRPIYEEEPDVPPVKPIRRPIPGGGQERPQKPRSTTPRPGNSRPGRPSKPESSTQGSKVQKIKHKHRHLLPEKNCGQDLGMRILGGAEAEISEHPWMALVRLRLTDGRTAFFCGGSVINQRYVLTAAHCLKGSGVPPGGIVDMVRLGEHDLSKAEDCNENGRCSSPAIDIPVEQRIIHPDFTPRDPGTYNDIALLRLKRDINFNVNIQPICLPLDGKPLQDSDRRRLVTVGWGRTSNGSPKNSAVKRKVTVPVVTSNECAPQYLLRKITLRDTQVKLKISHKPVLRLCNSMFKPPRSGAPGEHQTPQVSRWQLCAGGEPGKDSCQGDSGGPLMSYDSDGTNERWHIQGITSTGPKDCGLAENPAIYTRVAKFIPWILDNIKE